MTIPSPEAIDAVRRCRDEGLSALDIAVALRCSVTAVERALAMLKRPTVDRLAEMVASGMTDYAIAKQYETTRNTIAAMRRRAGIKANAPWTPERKALHAKQCRAAQRPHIFPSVEVPKPIDERLWKKAMAGGAYSDHPRAAAPQAFAKATPPESIAAPSNMAWSA